MAWFQFTLKKEVPLALFSCTVALYDDKLNTGALSFTS